MKIKKTINIIFIILVIYIYSDTTKTPSMEEYNISSAFGVDIKKEAGNITKYKVPFSVYKFKTAEKEDTMNKIGESTTLVGTRENRQLNSNKPSLVGIQKNIILEEKTAKNGLGDLINVNFSNPQTNDRSFIIISKQTSEEILSTKIKGYKSTGDYIQSLVDNSINYNFFTKEYTMLNVYVRLGTEGRNVVLPYIEVKNKELIMSGVSVFRKDKLAYILPIEEAKIMNMLREKSAKGILTIQESTEKYINYDSKFKKKVKCNKNDNKYEFNIELVFNGTIINDTKYKEMNLKDKKEFEDLMAKKIERMCSGFLEKMQKEYKMDMLELGMHAAAKYGRDTGTDWDKAVSNADIKVKVKVKVDNIGRGHS